MLQVVAVVKGKMTKRMNTSRGYVASFELYQGRKESRFKIKHCLILRVGLKVRMKQVNVPVFAALGGNTSYSILYNNFSDVVYI